MGRPGWFGERPRHALAARGIETSPPMIMRGVGPKIANKYDEAYFTMSEQSLAGDLTREFLREHHFYPTIALIAYLHDIEGGTIVLGEERTGRSRDDWRMNAWIDKGDRLLYVDFDEYDCPVIQEISYSENARKRKFTTKREWSGKFSDVTAFREIATMETGMSKEDFIHILGDLRAKRTQQDDRFRAWAKKERYEAVQKGMV